MRRLSTLSLGWLLILVAPSAFGQTPTLIEAAKKEGGKVIVYTSMETFTADALQKAFQSKTGLQMEYWRDHRQRLWIVLLSEHRVGKPIFDVVATTGDHMQLMAKEGAFNKYESPSLKGFAKDAIDPVLGARYRNVLYGVIYNKKWHQSIGSAENVRRCGQTGVPRQARHAASGQPHPDNTMAGESRQDHAEAARGEIYPRSRGRETYIRRVHRTRR